MRERRPSGPIGAEQQRWEEDTVKKLQPILIEVDCTLKPRIAYNLDGILSCLDVFHHKSLNEMGQMVLRVTLQRIKEMSTYIVTQDQAGNICDPQVVNPHIFVLVNIRHLLENMKTPSPTFHTVRQTISPEQNQVLQELLSEISKLQRLLPILPTTTDTSQRTTSDRRRIQFIVTDSRDLA